MDWRFEGQGQDAVFSAHFLGGETFMSRASSWSDDHRQLRLAVLATSPGPPCVPLAVVSLAPLLAALILGCTADPIAPKTASDQGTSFVVSSADTVDDLARPWGLNPLRVDGVSLVTGLPGTGSDPPPSPEREMLLREMQVRRVEFPNRILQSPDTSLVLVRGWIPPGAREGEHFDVEVLVPHKSETKSLDRGWLMLTRLLEYAVIHGRLSTGNEFGSAEGSVVVDELLESSDDPAFKRRGRVLGGGVVKRSRNLGLVLRPEHRSFSTSARMGQAINERFFLYENGIKRGVANPKRDDFIELLVHPSYRENIVRYVRVVQSIVVRETASERMQRAEGLRSQLLRPATAAMAAVQLEAIGKDGARILREALSSSDPEIRFYAAEALAYLDDPSSTSVLADAIRDEPAFRQRALIALGAMTDPAAHEALVSLLDVESAETRYGAFRQLKQLLPDDPMIAGELINDDFYLHQVSSQASPLLHIARSERSEIVLFGEDVSLLGPCVLFAGPRVVVRIDLEGEALVTKLTGAPQDESKSVAGRLTAIIRAITDLGGSYCDVVRFLREAKAQQVLPARLEFSAIAATGRTYQRGKQDESDGAEQDEWDAWERNRQSEVPVTDLTASNAWTQEGTESGTNMPASHSEIESLSTGHDSLPMIPELDDLNANSSEKTAPSSDWTPEQIDAYLDAHLGPLAPEP